MSDHPREEKRIMEKIFICNDILLDSLPFCGHPKVGLEFAVVSDRFDIVVDTHLKRRKWKLGSLRIERSNTNDGAEIVKCNSDKTVKRLPIPLTALPPNVIGFKRIAVYHINRKVIAFLHRIRRLFATEITLELAIFFRQSQSWDVLTYGIWPALNPAGIVKIRFHNINNVTALQTHISPTILHDCANLRSIDVNHIYRPLTGQIGDEFSGADTPDDQALYEWLSTPREDGRPKLLKTYFSRSDVNWTAQMKTKFQNATVPVNFYICCIDMIRLRPHVQEDPPFTMMNWQTNEQLALRRGVKQNCWQFERGPIERNAKQWAEWEHEAAQDTNNNASWNVLTIWVQENSVEQECLAEVLPENNEWKQSCAIS